MSTRTRTFHGLAPSTSPALHIQPQTTLSDIHIIPIFFRASDWQVGIHMRPTRHAKKKAMSGGYTRDTTWLHDSHTLYIYIVPGEWFGCNTNPLSFWYQHLYWTEGYTCVAQIPSIFISNERWCTIRWDINLENVGRNICTVVVESHVQTMALLYFARVVDRCCLQRLVQIRSLLSLPLRIVTISYKDSCDPKWLNFVRLHLWRCFRRRCAEHDLSW